MPSLDKPQTDFTNTIDEAALVGAMRNASELGWDGPPNLISAVRTVVDPELGLSVVDLGLVYGIAVTGGAVRVTMTLTAPGCPLHALIGDWARRAVLAVPGVETVEVELTFDPPWTPARIASR